MDDLVRAHLDSFDDYEEPPTSRMEYLKESINKRLRVAYRFFRKHGGGIVGENAKGALDMARAEAKALALGAEFMWSDDSDCDWSFVETWSIEEQERWHRSYHHAEKCVLVMPCPEHGRHCPHAITLGAVSGIVDADSDYRRVVAAELALDVDWDMVVPDDCLPF